MPVLILFNAFFVTAEMALARIRGTRLDQLVESGNKTAEVARKALDNPDRYISACQLGITFATLALGAIGEHTFAQEMANAIHKLGILAQWPDAVDSAAKAICYFLAFSLTAFIQTVFGELLPKTLTFSRAETVMMTVIWPMEAWCWVTSPFLIVLNGFTAFILRLMRIKEPPRHLIAHSGEELKMLVSASHEEGVLEVEEQEMLHSVFDFSDTVASDVMTPRTDMICAAATTSVKDFLKLSLEKGLSRLPVFEEDLDNIFGVVHVRDALRAMVEHKEASQIRELTRKVLIVPENKNVGDLLSEFKKSKTHMAIVVDEYGSTRGLVTIEDLLEELVGDIADEYDIIAEHIQLLEDGTYILDARIALEEVNEKLGLEIEDEEFNTLGGHVFGQLGREPKIGDEICSTKGYILRIVESDRHRIMKLRLIRNATTSETPEGTTKGAATATKNDSVKNLNGEHKPTESDQSAKSLKATK